MRLLPPHFWPIIYLWTMVGLSCRPAHKLLWQRLKGKHLLGRLLPPWGCKKDRGNVSRDKDRGTYRHHKGFNEGRGQVGVCWPGSVFWRICACMANCKGQFTLVPLQSLMLCKSELSHWSFACGVQSFLPTGQDLSLSCTWYITHPAHCHTPGQKGAGAWEGVTLRTLQGVRWVPSFPHILSYKCHEDKFGVGEILALLLPGGYHNS